MFITGIGTASPGRRYTQSECLEAIRKTDLHADLTARSRALLGRFLRGSNGVGGRYLALDALAEVNEHDPDALHRRFIRHAPALAIEAARRALEDAGIAAGGIDAVVACTCTGYLCPGLSGYLIEHLDLRPEILALDLVGHGCAAALPNLRTAQALLAGSGCRHVLSVCVEVCSAAFYLDDDPGVLVSACLFGDGAGAAILSGEPATGGRTMEWTAYGSIVDPSQRDALRFEQRRGLLRNILTPPVPRLAAEYAGRVFGEVAARTGVNRDRIGAWILHAGGRDVLNALAGRMDLGESDLHWSRETLEHYGNLSSAFVYFVLKAARDGGAPDGWWWLSSFGAGFSCHGALLSIRG